MNSWNVCALRSRARRVVHRLSFLALALSACGGPGTPTDAGDAATRVDTVSDAVSIDALVDARPDTVADTGTDAGFDAGTDATPPDVAIDMGVDSCAMNADPLDDMGVDTNCDGADGIAEQTIFVAQGGAGTGLTPDSPVGTIAAARGVQIANPSRTTILIASGSAEYSADGLGALLQSGSRIIGGFNTPAWNRPAGTGTAPTSVATTRDGVYVEGGAGASIQYINLHVDGTLAAAGPHSFALVLNGASNFTIDRSRLQSGAGQPGTNGAAGAMATIVGIAGAGSTVNGMGSTTGTCGGGQSLGTGAPGAACPGGTGNVGGNGGCNNARYCSASYPCPAGQNCTSGRCAPPPTLSMSGTTGGGVGGGSGGGTGTYFTTCANVGGSNASCGGTGQPGAAGTAGMASSTRSMFMPSGSTTGYAVTLPVGGAGTYGVSGGGGGGGGLWVDSGGATLCGGGGGGGGCGGGGGAGGAMGGASAALVVNSSVSSFVAPVITNSTIVFGQGGTGGAGGGGGNGSSGGAGGTGMTCNGLDCGCAEHGTNGGVGGLGGVGGGGAGGAGGASAGILSFGLSISVPASVMITGPASGSPGGSGGGSGPARGASGATGAFGLTVSL